MDTAQWPQRIGVAKQQGENSRLGGGGGVEKKPRPQKEQALNCPRCSSTNTKFCYYNNYSLSQPRYFCKTCRRYWTEGGSLRNVPVGGGSRKNKRSSSMSTVSSSPAGSSKKAALDQLGAPSFLTPNPKIHEGQDLNLVYNPSHYTAMSSEFASFPFGSGARNVDSQNPNNPTSSSSDFPVMELLKTGISSRGLGCFMPNGLSDHHNSNLVFSSGFPHMHGLIKPSLSFSLDGAALDTIGYGNLQLGSDQGPVNSSKIDLSFEELKPESTANDDHEFHNQRGGGGGEADQANGYWNAMLGGGSW